MYDPVGNVLSVTDPDGNVTGYAYDRLNRQVSVTDPLDNVASMVYDLAGNLVQRTDADGRVTQYLYNPVNGQVEEDWLSGTSVAGLSGTGSASVFHTIQTYYDAAGEVVGVVESDTQNPADATSYQYGFDHDGNLAASRMAPGDLAQSPELSGNGSLG